MIDSVLLVDDEPIYHSLFEDACSLLDICLNIQMASNVAEVELMFKSWNKGEGKKPEVVFVDSTLAGSAYDGFELIRKINQDFGNGVVIGVISSRSEKIDTNKAQASGAMFWLIKSDEIEARLEQFKRDFLGFKSKSLAFKVYS